MPQPALAGISESATVLDLPSETFDKLDGIRHAPSSWMEIKSFRDLEVWQVSMTLVERTYAVSETFPAAEKFGLTSQMRRAAVSIPSNIAEGHGRSTGSYRYHLGVARGSEAELQTQIELAVRLGFTSREAIEPIRELAARSGMMLNRLIASLGVSEAEP